MNDLGTHSNNKSLWMRLISMIIIGLLFIFVQSLFWTIVGTQFIIMLFNNLKPNALLAEISTKGGWMASSVCHQTTPS